MAARIAILGLGIAATAAAGQYGLWQPPSLQGLKRVEEGVSDVGPLGASQRLVPMDLRVPTGFEGVYEFQRERRWDKPETMYMRVSGGMAAVFPRSVYVEAGGGLIPEIPAGTVFLIGTGEGAWMPTPGRWSTSPLAVDLRYTPEMETVAAPPRQEEAATEPPTIWTSESFRRARTQTLLESTIARP
jgi:hypothetical protein